jgi:hypothetical protein
MAKMRSDTWLNTVTVNGTLFPGPNGVWDTFKGGEVDSEASTYKAGGMVDQEAIGGQETIGPVTLDKALDLQADWGVAQQLMAASIGNAPIVISRQPLDINKNPSGNPLTYKGIVKSCSLGDTDSNKSDIQMWTISAVVSGPIGIA